MTDPLTVGFIVLVVALITLYDVWTLWRRGYNTTVSWNLYIIARRFPIVPFLVGLLVGHLWFPNQAGMGELPVCAAVQKK